MKKFMLFLFTILVAGLMSVSIFASDVSTEITTIAEEKTEVSTEEYQNYSSYYYKGTGLYSEKDIPTGRYVLIPDADKIATVNVYIYGNGTNAKNGGKEDIFISGCEYQEIVDIEGKQFVDVCDGALVPSKLVPKRDATKNGTFRVGIDIPIGNYTFKLDESSCVGYAVVDYTDDSFYPYTPCLNEDCGFISFKLEGGRILRKYGVDIFDSTNNMLFDYTPVSDVKSELDLKYNFKDVRESLKESIVKELLTEIRKYSYASLSSNRYREEYVNNKIDIWKNLAQNDAEKEYVEMVSQIYKKFYDFTYNSYIVYASKIDDSENYYFESCRSLKYDRNSYLKITSDLLDAQSFSECEKIKYNFYALYYGIHSDQKFDLYYDLFKEEEPNGLFGPWICHGTSNHRPVYTPVVTIGK